MSKRLFFILVGGIIGLVALLLGTRSANHEFTDSFDLLNVKLDSISNRHNDIEYTAEFESFNIQCADLIGFIEDLKNEIKMGSNYESADSDVNSNIDDILFDGNRPSARALELVAKIAGLRADIDLEFGDLYPEIVVQSNELLDTSSLYDEEGYETPWLVYSFKDNSSIVVLERLTQLQEDVAAIRSQVTGVDFD